MDTGSSAKKRRERIKYSSILPGVQPFSKDKETPKIERSLLWFCSRSGSRDKGLGRTSCSGSFVVRCQQADQGALVAHEAALFARAPGAHAEGSGWAV